MPGARKRKRQRDGAAPSVPLLPPDVHEDEIEISNEDVEFVSKNKNYAGFLSGLDTKGITKQVLGLKPDWNGDSIERFYERTKVKDSKEVPSVDPVDALPIKNLDGKLEYRRIEKQKPQLQQQESPEEKQDQDEKEKEQSKKKKKRENKAEKKAVKSKKEPTLADQEEKSPIVKKSKLQAQDLEFVSVEDKRSRMKEKIAHLSTMLMSSPEELIGHLKELLSICWDKDEVTKHFAMLSLMAIFRDILPGYRIRPPTEKELEMKVSKEVKKLRDYESSLLKFYQGYVQALMKWSNVASGRRVALKCMCCLLESVPHFNFADHLLRALVPFLNSPDPAERNLASAAFCSLFKNEKKHGGEATLEAVQLIADYVKENDCDVQSDVLQVFASLTFDEDIVDWKDNAGKKTKPKSTKRQNNYKNKNDDSTTDLSKEVEADFREASTLPDAEERRRLQTGTLSAVFETYFRVLKASVASGSSHPLLATCLQGLLKFSHLISVDFLGDLLAVLRKLAEGKFTVEERLQCCVAAFRIMKANLDALTVDLKEFFVNFYDVLLYLCPDRNEDTENCFAEALQVILCESRHHDLQRVAAFAKRLAAVSFHFGSSTAMAALSTIRHLLLRHKKCRNLLENDGSGGNATVFHLNEPDPDLSGALSSVLWEIALLRKHYNPDVAKISQQIANVLASESFAGAMSPTDATSLYSTQQGGFRPAVKLPPAKIVKKNSYKPPPPSKNNDEDEEEDGGVEFGGYFRLIRDIAENEALRKELVRCKTMVESYDRYKSEKRSKKSKTKPATSKKNKRP